MKGNGFSFLGKNLTTEGKIIPYSTIGAGYYGNNEVTEAEFTIYDEAFNKVKTFSYPFKQFTYKKTPMTALVDITKKTLVDTWDKWPMELGKDSVFNTMDEFQKFVLENNPQITAEDFFIDDNGNFAYHFHDKSWTEFYGMKDIDNNEVPTVRQHYYYYNKEEKAIYYYTAIFAVELDLANAAFAIDETRSAEENTNNERVDETDVYDYDLGCYEHCYGYISQNIFNKDDQFEFLVTSYKEVAAPADENTTFSNGLNCTGAENGKLRINKWVQDKHYASYTKVVNESGKELFTLPNAYKGLSMYRINGKTYVESCEYDQSATDNRYTYVIYVLDETGTGITELARTKQVPAPMYFNTQGMKVDKNAKGIVIQKGGAKFLNK